ncbi:hypothetical protein BJ742DRAFT_407304 [Cladochytrium replicatum]|nr:hypothetical protein BJ742DRAFT_407304 [Cladochytrium replicatum]
MTTTNTNVWSCSKHRSAHHAVFVSYRQNGSDSLLAELFCAEMEADLTKRYHPASLPVFLDKRCLPIGGDWSEGFINGLQKSRVIVYLLSKESIRTMLSKLEKGQRDNVLVEIEEGLQLKSIADRATTLIPVLIGNYHHSHANQMEKLVPFAEFDESTLEHSKSGLKVKETMANLFKFQGLHLDPKNVAASVNVIIEELGRIEVPQSFCSWATPTQTQTALGSQHQLHSRPNPTIYINRDDILSQIDTTLRSNASTSSTAVLKGVGGSGKTFIATKYGYQCVDRGYQVAWLKADSEEAVKESYIAFAQWILRDYTISQLACFTLSNVMTMVESTSAKYPTTKKLMIFDNIEDYQHIQEIIRAHPNAQFLLTTRNPLYRDGLLMPFIKVDLPDSSRAEQFVVQSIPTLDLVHATTIVQQCEQLPLRLEITVKYLQQIFNNVNNYSVRKRKAGPEVAITATAVIAGKANKEHSQESIDYQKPIDYSKFVTKIINDYTSDVQNAKVACNEDSHPEIVVSLNYLMDQNKNAFEMFQLCAYLDPDAVSLDIIVDFQKRQSAQFWAPILHNFSKKVQKNLSESVPLLKELGLVKELGTVSNSVIVCIHRCVQAQLKASIKDENSKSMLAKEFYAQKMSQVRHAAMQYELGIQNFMKARLAERDGTPGTVSYQSALQYFQKAADIGHTQSCLALYIIFEFGFGVGVDKAISSHWCSKAGLSKAEVNCVKFDVQEFLIRSIQVLIHPSGHMFLLHFRKVQLFEILTCVE